MTIVCFVKNTSGRYVSFECSGHSGYACEGEDIKIYVCGGGFLYNMVRTMAGTMLGCAQGRIALGDIERSLAERDRTLVGKTMPARGLTLLAVDYGFALFKE